MRDIADITDRWTILKLDPPYSHQEVRGLWAVYPPYAGWGQWTDLCDTWEQAMTKVDMRAYGRVR